MSSGEKRGRGRPPLPPDSKRTERAEVRFTPAELTAIDEKCGPDRAEWLRRLALSAVGYGEKSEPVEK